MFSYSSDPAVLPSLTFSKAELIYALAYLMRDIPNSDTNTQIEMVEVRHYLNQIHEKVLLAAYNGSLNKIGIEIPPEASNAPESKKTPIPTIQELKAQFPTLSEEEIREIWDSAQRDKAKEDAQKKASEPPSPPPPSFVSKKSIPDSPSSVFPEERKKAENSKKFASLLGL